MLVAGNFLEGGGEFNISGDGIQVADNRLENSDLSISGENNIVVGTVSTNSNLDVSAYDSLVEGTILEGGSFTLLGNNNTIKDTTSTNSDIDILSDRTVVVDAVLEGSNLSVSGDSMEVSSVNIENGSFIFFGNGNKASGIFLEGGNFDILGDSSGVDDILLKGGSVTIEGDGIEVGNLSIEAAYEDGEGNQAGRGSVTLISTQDVSTGDITTERGDVFISGVNIVTGTIDTSTDDRNEAGGVKAGDVTLMGSGSVTVEDIAAHGLHEDLAGNGGDVAITAGENVLVQNIHTSAESTGELQDDVAGNSGDVSMTANRGSITTRGITAGSETSGQAGSVQLTSPGSIEIKFIDARQQDNNSSNKIEIDTYETFVATGVSASSGESISTSGTTTTGGSISITVGDVGMDAEGFSIGNSLRRNNIAGDISTGEAAIADFDTAVSYSLQNIQLIDQGVLLPEPPLEGNNATVIPPLAPAEVPEVVATLVAENDSEDGEDVFEKIELNTSGEFLAYLGLDVDGEEKPKATVAIAQNRLAEVENSTGVKPALVYIYFVPDAKSEEAVTTPQKRESRPDDQLEVIVITQEGKPVQRRQWGVTRQQVEEAGQSLRRETTSQFSTERQYLPPAQQLYDWIMAPIADVLEKQSVQSLGFVMDTGIRTLPMATLHSGDRFLVEDYSLGLLPTFSLTNFADNNTGEHDIQNARVLAMGASEFEDQPDLPAVGAEVKLIAERDWQGKSFLNENFVLENLQAELQQQDYEIVHLATHATFTSGDVDNSYIQLWDEKLALSEVDDLGLSDADISLMILSACNTAMGDTASEYGFAGFAVSSGSQSALASLWPVSDEGTLGFMSEFYESLRESSVKADALRQAQISMIGKNVGIVDGEVYGPEGESIATLAELAESGQWDFSHPFYWSAFTMIGNPW